jgi:tetratricopeptide (TPR) repeat protein
LTALLAALSPQISYGQDNNEIVETPIVEETIDGQENPQVIASPDEMAADNDDGPDHQASVPQNKNSVSYEQPLTSHKAVVSASGAETQPVDDEAVEGELQLQLARVRLLAETRRRDEAFALLKQLKSTYPDNPQLLLAEADLNFQRGNRGAGFALLNKASILDPNNEDIIQRQRAAVITQGPYLEVGHNIRRTSSAYENITHVGGQVTVSNSTSVGVEVENNNFDSRRPIIRPNGVASDFNENRQRASLMLNHVFANGNEATGSLYVANEIVGGGGEYRWWDYRGVTTFQANLYRPNWDFVESVVSRGTKSNVLVQRQQRLTDDITATIGAGFNHYELNDVDNAAQAPTWNANIGYNRNFTLGDGLLRDWNFGAYYNVDAEYYTHVESRVGPGNVRFKPLPAEDYEIHSFYGSLGKAFLESLLVEAYGGYSVNRLTGFSGPLYGTLINYAPMDQLGLEVRASRSQLGGQSNREQVDQVGMNVKWLW